MKRLFIVLSFLLLVFYINAETKYFKAKFFNIRYANEQWLGWQKSDVIIEFDTNKKTITIFSPELQVIKYDNFEWYPSTIILYRSYGEDKNCIALTIKIFCYHKVSYLKICYADIQYKYQILPYIYKE